MKNNVDQMYAPLLLLKKITARYPNCWELVEKLRIHDDASSSYPVWEPWCYIPIGGTLAITQMYNFSNRSQAVDDACAMAALAPWRHDKEVFVMDEDTENLLLEQDDTEIPSEVLLHLPYMCFYIQFATITEAHGVFVHLEDDVKNGDRELRLVFVRNDGEVGTYMLHIDAQNISHSIEMTKAQARKVELRHALHSHGYVNITYQLLQDVLQLVLYVCANNADVQPNPEQQSTTTNSRVIKDRYVEIRKWDVGVRIGDAIRAMTSTQPVNHQEKKPGTHASPRPHMRRGHWHYFWTGSKSEPSERKLVLRWVAPMPIGITGGDTPVVLHRVT